jgi:hypothetical protein
MAPTLAADVAVGSGELFGVITHMHSMARRSFQQQHGVVVSNRRPGSARRKDFIEVQHPAQQAVGGRVSRNVVGQIETQASMPRSFKIPPAGAWRSLTG